MPIREMTPEEEAKFIRPFTPEELQKVRAGFGILDEDAVRRIVREELRAMAQAILNE